MPNIKSARTFNYFKNHNISEYLSWYWENRRDLVRRLVKVQAEGDYQKNTILFDRFMTEMVTIKQLHKEMNLSKKRVRQIINRGLEILNSRWERYHDKQSYSR